MLWGLPIAAAGLTHNAGEVVVLIGIAGAGVVLLDIPGFSLVQRCAPDHALARVFGAVEGLLVGAVSLGTLCGGMFVSAFGTQVALLVTGLFTPAVVVLAWGACDRVDERTAEIAAVPGLGVGTGG